MGLRFFFNFYFSVKRGRRTYRKLPNMNLLRAKPLSRASLPWRRIQRGVTYEAAYHESLNSRNKFWGDAAKGITWSTPYVNVFDGSNSPFQRWFVGGELNTCFNAVDRHVEKGLGSNVALIHDSPVTNSKSTLTYNDLKDRVMKVAGVLKKLGVKRGDTVIIYLPMIPEAVIAMLACARIGAIHSVVFGGFAAPELAVRIKDCKPNVILCSSCGIEGDKIIQYKPLVDEAIQLASLVYSVSHCVVLQRQQFVGSINHERDHDWQELEKNAIPVTACEPMRSEDPLYILYTSGTTGERHPTVKLIACNPCVINYSQAAQKAWFGILEGMQWHCIGQ